MDSQSPTKQEFVAYPDEPPEFGHTAGNTSTIPHGNHFQEDFKKSTEESDVRGHYFRRTNPPGLSPSPVAVAELAESSHSTVPKGSLTATGAQRAKQAGAAISPDFAKTEQQYKQVRADISKHQDRWASYGKLNSSFTHPPSGPYKVDVDTSATNEQPLLALFEAELAKMTPSPSQSDEPKQVEKSDVDIQGNNVKFPVMTPQSDKSAQTKIPQRFLKDLFSGIGDLASEVLERSPELAERLNMTTQDFQANLNNAIKVGSETVQNVRGLVGSSTKMSEPSSAGPNQATTRRASSDLLVPEHAATPGVGFLSWIAGCTDESHNLSCVDGCDIGGPSCPVRLAVGDLVQRMQTPRLPPSGVDKSSQQASVGSQTISGSSRVSASTLNAVGLGKKSFEADQILAKRYISYNSPCGPSKRQYLIRWLGHGPEHDVWYDAENLGGCKGLVEQFEKSVESKAQNAHQFSQPQIHSIHLRTAGDRMVASPKWEESKEMETHRRLYKGEEYRRKKPNDFCSGESRGEDNTEKPNSLSNTAPTPAPTSSVEDVTSSGGKPMNELHSTLRHRRSWAHSVSNPIASHRASSPSSVAERYPSLLNFEAAHAGLVVDKRRSLPVLATSSSSARRNDSSSLDLRRPWYDTASYPIPKDKSVRFNLADPWLEKKEAQKRWEAELEEEQSLYGAPEVDPPSTPSRREGKKPARYSSPPPPLPVPEAEASTRQEDGKPKALSGSDPSLRRVKSLGSGIKEMQKRSDANYVAGLHSDGFKNASTNNPAMTGMCNAVHNNPSTWKDATSQRNAQDSLRRLRRAASARFPSKEDRQLHSSWRELIKPEDQAPGWPLPEPARPSAAMRQNSNPCAAHTRNVTGSSAAFGTNPQNHRYQGVLRPSHNLRTANTLQRSPVAFNTSTSASTEVQHPPVIFAPASGAQRHRIVDPPASVTARGGHIKMTADRLLEMGFSQAEARTVAESVNGDLDQALDMLHEDQQARRLGFDADMLQMENNVDDEGRRMPGGFI